MFYVSRNLAAF